MRQIQNSRRRQQIVLNSIRYCVDSLEARRLLSNPAFFSPAGYAAGAGASAIITADFNGDGKLDLATANYSESDVSILLNSGDGTFGLNSDYAVGANPTALAAADLNGDSKLDLIVANTDDNTISVLLNNGNGTFADKVDYAAGVNPISVAAADFNGDGQVDIAVANAGTITEINAGDQNLRIFTNVSNGTSFSVTDLALEGTPTVLAAADFTGDAMADLVVTFDYPASMARTFVNDGIGGFVTGNDYPTGQRPQSIFVADMDHSGTLDLVIDSSYSELNVYLNSGNGTFANNAEYRVSDYSAYQTHIALGDFNGDGYSDVACSFLGDWFGVSYLSTPTMLLNQRNGTLSAPIDAAFPYDYTSPMVAGDFNGDDLSDIASGNYYVDVNHPAVSVAINAGESLFGERTIYREGLTRPGGVVPGDLNNDGRVDLFVSGSTVGSRAYLQNADGTFAYSSIWVDSYLLDLVDLNRDGFLDAISTSYGIGVQLNNGDGTFGAFADYFPSDVYSNTGLVKVADINGDGWLDLAASPYGASTVSVRLNRGDGTFANATNYAGAGMLAVGDFTGDRQIDIAVSTATGVKILTNTGNGLFADGPFTAVGKGELIDADFDGDHDTDLALSTDGGLILLRNRGNGSFVASTIYAGFNVGNLTKADFNGDGRIDIATTGLIYLNKGSGLFATPIAYPVGQYAEGVASADLNNDGRPDLAWANYFSNSISIILNDHVINNIPTPGTPDLEYSYDSGRSHVDNITYATTPVFSGTGLPGMTVILYSDGVEIGRSCVGDFGSWSVFVAGNLTDGTHLITATQGNAFGTSPISAPLVLKIDTGAPSVSSASFDYNRAPHTVTLGYSEEVSWSLGAGDFQLSNLTVPSVFSVAHSYSGGRSHIQSIKSPVLPDGNYLLRVIAAGVQDLAGNALAVDYEFAFFVLAGDANRDRKVDLADLAIVSRNWRGSGKVFSQGEFNYDGKVDASDLSILAARWQQSLQAPQAPAQTTVPSISVARRTPVRVASSVLT